MLSLLLLIFSFSANAQERFDVNDVSFLFPRKSQSEAPSYLLNLERTGRRGPLLSYDTYRKMAIFEDRWFYDQFFVTAVRFEPCTEGNHENPASCKSELRLTAQRIFKDAVTDSGLHLIYRIEASEIESVLTRLRELKKLSPISTNGFPLSIHPALRFFTPALPFYKNLLRLVLDFAGQDNLIRLASSETIDTAEWRFEGFLVRDGGEIVRDQIPNIDFQSVNVEFNSFTTRGFISPKPKTPVTLEGIMVDSRTIESSVYDSSFFKPESSFAASARYAATVENPLLGTHRLNTDCATCHAASRTVAITKSFFDDLKTGRPFPWAFDDLKFKLAGYTLTPDPAPSRKDSIVAFGYDGFDPAIMQRTINESAIVADWINRHSSESAQSSK